MIEEIQAKRLTNNAGLDSLICSGNCKFADKQTTNKLCHNTVWKIKNSLHIAQLQLSSGLTLRSTMQRRKKAVKAMIEAGDKTPLVDAFYRTLEFGTGGLRGIMGPGTNRMNVYVVGAATQGLANYLLKNFADRKEISVVVGHDCRNNSRLFAETVANVFSANGIKVYLFDDLRPTPEVSFAIRHFGCQSGVTLRPATTREYNGYKAYWDVAHK